jgi:RHS repeat-associated protein
VLENDNGRKTITLNPRLDLGHGFQRVIEANGTTITDKLYVSVGGRNIALINSGAANDSSYMHHDHLGSVIAVTDANGQVVARYHYDAWGKQTQTAGSTSPTRRGFTGHEEIVALGLVNMNGRVYDPVIGRFMSVDPMLQDPTNWQNYNGYSYVLNDPLMLTDPSGHMNQYFKAVASIAVMAMAPELSQFIWGSTGLGAAMGFSASSPITIGATAGFVSGGIQGGTMKSALEGGVFGALSAEIGQKWGDGTFNNVAAHAILGGVQSETMGGQFL